MVGPLAFVCAASGFAPILPSDFLSRPADLTDCSATFREDVMGANDEVLGQLIAIPEADAEALRRLFGGTKSDGGEHWRPMEFDETGRKGFYTNTNGGAAGTVIVQGWLTIEFEPSTIAPGYDPLVAHVLMAEWIQRNGRGKASIAQDGSDLSVEWGPQLKNISLWKRTN